MGLKDLGISQEIITTPGGEFAVRGLSLPDITLLAEKYFPVMEKLFNEFSGADPMKMEGEVKQTLAVIIRKEAPDAIAEIIALASGEYDDEAIKAARHLPFTVQIEALNKIGKLTFKSEADLGNALTAVISMFQGSSKAIARLSNGISL